MARHLLGACEGLDRAAHAKIGMQNKLTTASMRGAVLMTPRELQAALKARGFALPTPGA